jgi:hypothetical protein
LVTEFSLGRFEPFLGQAFEIGEGPGAVSAVLIDAINLREAQGVGYLSRQFSLVWRGPRNARLEQGIYPVRHPELGTMELFLVCIGPDAEGMRYEAVFT